MNILKRIKKIYNEKISDVEAKELTIDLHDFCKENDYYNFIDTEMNTQIYWKKVYEDLLSGHIDYIVNYLEDFDFSDNKIFCIMGKSCSGKSTAVDEIKKRLNLISPSMYTTRPRRNEDDNDYIFVSDESFEKLCFLEKREYKTVHGIWKYGTLDNFDLNSHSYVLAATPSMFIELKKKYSINVVPIYIDIDPKKRISLLIKRESENDYNDFEELCRRYLSDEKDFYFIENEIMAHPERYIVVKNNDLDTFIHNLTNEVSTILKESL